MSLDNRPRGVLKSYALLQRPRQCRFARRVPSRRIWTICQRSASVALL